jgi:simple sugar transport system substrate-binding protein
MRRSVLFGMLAATALAILPSGARAQEKLKIGFIYVGPVGDFGWSYQHDVGRKAVEAAFPGRVETTFIETVPEAGSDRVISFWRGAATS